MYTTYSINENVLDMLCITRNYVDIAVVQSHLQARPICLLFIYTQKVWIQPRTQIFDSYAMNQATV